MFINDLFTHSGFENIDTGFKTVVEFNWDHSVFKGHFPDRPVVPGVLLMQMVKECFECFLDIDTDLKGADMKFTNPVTPQNAPSVTLEVNFSQDGDGKYNIKSNGYTGEIKFFKIKTELVKAGSGSGRCSRIPST